MSKFLEKFKINSILIVASLLLFLLIFGAYKYAGSEALTKRCPYDSYTFQALAWRDGRISLPENAAWLELAVLNDTYFENNSMDDYEAYKEYFYDESGQFIEYEENEYYVSFPPFPTVPMFILTFIFGENTPGNIVGILYGIGALIFAVLLCKRFKYSNLYSICGGLLVTVASSTFFLFTDEKAGSVWFMAQLLSLFLTMAAFYFIHGKRERDIYLAFILLGFAVGCRPFQIIYYFYFAYVIWKRYDYKLLKTIKFYIPAAIIGICYMIYNYIRFGNIIEFGHNYLPEMMQAPDGQFNLSYVPVNFMDMFFKMPEMSDSAVKFSHIGFACWITNVIFIIAFISLVIRVIKHFTTRPVQKIQLLKKNYIEMTILCVLVLVHFVLILMHKSLGILQFGSRYTIDIFPAALLLILMALKPVTKKQWSIEKYVINYIGAVCIVGSSLLNVSASYKYMVDKYVAYNPWTIYTFIICFFISLAVFIAFMVQRIKYSEKV